MPPTTQTRATSTAAQRLLEERDKVARASEVIDRDPEEAHAVLEPHVQTSDNGTITMADMFGLFSQMQAQMGAMQAQVLTLMGQGPQNRSGADTAKELAADKAQRDATLKAWNDEPREPVQITPDQDEDKIFAINGKYPPRLYRVNGLEFPINVGEIVLVPQSIARLVQYTQRKRPMTGPPGLAQIADPAAGRFLLGAESISPGPTLQGVGRSGEGRLPPPMVPPHPQELGMQYDHNGQ